MRNYCLPWKIGKARHNVRIVRIRATGEVVGQILLLNPKLTAFRYHACTHTGLHRDFNRQFDAAHWIAASATVQEVE